MTPIIMNSSASTAAKLATMAGIAEQSCSACPAILRRALSLRGRRGLLSPAQACQLVTEYITRHVTYTADKPGYEEFYSPDQLFEIWHGDCDDQAMAVAALLATYGGIKLAFAAVSLDGSQNADHVVTVALVNGRWIPLETLPAWALGAERPAYGTWPRGSAIVAVVPLTSTGTPASLKRQDVAGHTSARTPRVTVQSASRKAQAQRSRSIGGGIERDALQLVLSQSGLQDQLDQLKADGLAQITNLKAQGSALSVQMSEILIPGSGSFASDLLEGKLDNWEGIASIAAAAIGGALCGPACAQVASSLVKLFTGRSYPKGANPTKTNPCGKILKVDWHLPFGITLSGLQLPPHLQDIWFGCQQESRETFWWKNRDGGAWVEWTGWGSGHPNFSGRQSQPTRYFPDLVRWWQKRESGSPEHQAARANLLASAMITSAIATQLGWVPIATSETPIHDDVRPGTWVYVGAPTKRAPASVKRWSIWLLLGGVVAGGAYLLSRKGA